MGFSVSGATAIILLGMLIAFGAAFSSVTNGFEQINVAQDDRSDRLVAQQNTNIEISSATYNESESQTLVVAVNNTGSQELSIDDTSLLVDGEFVPERNRTTTVNGNNDTALWAPGEQLVVNATIEEEPDRVKIATETGVAATNTSVEVFE